MAFSVESDTQLATDVGAPARALPLTGVAGTGSRRDPYSLGASPWQFLLAAGRATAANFAPERELFDCSSHWAIIRWFWALDWGSTEVRLSDHAAAIRNHHRTAFSEALGLSAALLLTEHIAGDTLPFGVWRGGPMLIDVDSWVSTGVRPDLLVLFGGSGTETFVIEAKGNSQDRETSITQLRRGLDQVLAAPGQAERLVIGVSAPGPALRAYAVSVKGSDPDESRSDDSELTTFDRGTLESERRRLSSFAGPHGLDPDAPTLEIPELGLDVIGRRVILKGASYDAELTMGVDREVVVRLHEIRSPAELSEMRSRISGQHQRTPVEEPPYNLAAEGRAATVATDGCALSISLI
jgi:hypothetical protein